MSLVRGWCKVVKNLQASTSRSVRARGGGHELAGKNKNPKGSGGERDQATLYREDRRSEGKSDASGIGNEEGPGLAEMLAWDRPRSHCCHFRPSEFVIRTTSALDRQQHMEVPTEYNLIDL